MHWFFPLFQLYSSQSISIQRRMSALPSMQTNDDIENIPTELFGKEAVIIRNIKKTFSGIGKTTVKAVQVGK